MPNAFVITDEHAWHKAIRALCNRPFASDEEMVSELVRRHNKVVDKDATTFHLGDTWFGDRTDGRFREYIASLNGEHVEVLGNHDRASVTQTNGWRHQREYLDAGFVAVVDSATLTLPEVSKKKIEGGAQQRKVLMSHFPYRADHKDSARYNQFRLRDEGMWLLHGHVHELYTVRDRGVNLGVDVWNFTPVNVHDIALLIAQVEAGIVEEF